MMMVLKVAAGIVFAVVVLGIVVALQDIKDTLKEIELDMMVLDNRLYELDKADRTSE